MKVAGGGPSVHACAVFLRAKSRDGKVCPKEALEHAYSDCTITRHGTGQSDTGGVGVGALGWLSGSGGVVHGRSCPSGFGAPGRRGGPRQRGGYSRDGREDRSAFAAPPCVRSPLLTLVRPLGSISGDSRPSWPPRLHVSRPAPPALVVRPPPLDGHRPLRSSEPPTGARRERPRPLQWAACLGIGAAQRRGASVTTWCPAPRVLVDGRRHAKFSTRPNPVQTHTRSDHSVTYISLFSLS